MLQYILLLTKRYTVESQASATSFRVPRQEATVERQGLIHHRHRRWLVHKVQTSPQQQKKFASK